MLSDPPKQHKGILWFPSQALFAHGEALEEKLAHSIGKSFDPPVRVIPQMSGEQLFNIPYKVFKSSLLPAHWSFWQHIYYDMNPVALVSEIEFHTPIVGAVGVVIDPKGTMWDPAPIPDLYQLRHLLTVGEVVRRMNIPLLLICLRQSETATEQRTLLGSLSELPELQQVSYHTDELDGIKEELVRFVESLE